ncbi:hypothetical protein LOZ65_000805 [Ophidiomyces ophidiicola]|nr:hypothetical protein LOZ65_000805 [Ophidiomyces ophidiicola]
MPFQEHTRTSDVLAHSQPSRDSTFTDFDIDNDTLGSRQHFRDNGSYALQEDQDLDYAINTSAIQSALPYFSSASSSDESDVPSIEIGRGDRNVSSRRDHSNSSVISNGGRKVACSAARPNEVAEPHPPRTALRTISNRTAARHQQSLRKDAQIRRASHVSQKENLDPKRLKVRNSKQETLPERSSRVQRPSLSEMHAKVSETYDGSYMSDERPTSATGAHKNTRFRSLKSQKKGADIIRAVNSAAKKQLNTAEKNTLVDSADEHTDLGESNNILRENTNHESFVLPDVPELSELVSGIYYEDLPQKSRHSRPRTTRFASPPATTMPEDSQEHVPFDAVPIPEDEKAIFASLKLLQDKILTLEKENSKVERRLEKLQEENHVLRNKSDDKQGYVYKSVEDDPGRGAATLAVERNRLESANMVLQNRLEIANHKIGGHDLNLQRAKKERDVVMNKLGVAYLSCQELRSDNEALRRDNEELQGQLSLLTSMPPVDCQEDSIPSVKSKSQNSRRRTTSASRSGSELKDKVGLLDIEQEQGVLNQNISKNSERRAKVLDETHTNQIKIRHAEKQQYEELFSLDLPSARKSKTQEKVMAAQRLSNTSKQRVGKPTVDNCDELSDSEMQLSKRLRAEPTQTRDLTFLSFIDGREIALLRKTLEEERIARKGRRSQNMDQGLQNDCSNLDAFKLDFLTAALSKRASQKQAKASTQETNIQTTSLDVDHHTSVSAKTGNIIDAITQGNNTTTGNKQHQTKLGDMTSAIILPDITLHCATTGENYEHINVSAAAQRVLNEVVSHKHEDCFVCQNSNYQTCDKKKTSINVPKPVPVSERTPAYNEEPTLRPSQKPSVALASVLKSLEDELAHLKIQLTVFQTAYAKHDASLGKRRRKALYQRIETLLSEIEKKSDQVYSLYDVLEGQKQHGDEMTDRQIEITLHSFGINAGPSEVPKRPEQRAGESRKKNHNTSQSFTAGINSDSNEEELPWEGFDTTIESTGRSFVNKKSNNR